jgi:2-succinyl-5-enolpyruvyl-6-hydroxy-3-cyclohexene-1-carboxylate synthase
VVTTSGTAAVELHPAVVEAHHDAVPLIACTADRPRWLRGTGAPQTIDQSGLYGQSVRAFVEPGVARWEERGAWRSLARGAVEAALGSPPGPVHLNLELDEPLVGTAAVVPNPDDRPPPSPAVPAGMSAAAAEAVDSVAGAARGLIVAGGAGVDPDVVHGLAETMGWPVLADPRSGARVPAATTVAHFDALLRVPELAAHHRPDIVLQLGGLPASRVLMEWLAACDAAGTRRVVVDPWGRRYDPSRSAAAVVAADPVEVCRRLASGSAASDHTDTGWQEAWIGAEQAAAQAIAAVVDDGPLSEPLVARSVVEGLPSGASLVVASSMPVRDVEWYAAPRTGLRVLANRGANGIDGVVSTAVGVAVGGGNPVGALAGDLAFLHDTNALLGLADRGADLRIVVVDNRGGGIFSFLPHADALPADVFERYFGTPHRADLVALATAHGIDAAPVDTAAELTAALGQQGPWVRVVRTDRAANAALHHHIHAAVAAAVEATLA